MNHETQRASILQMAQGAFQERVDYEMQRCVDNILDVNTKATAKRKITLTIELTPAETLKADPRECCCQGHARGDQSGRNVALRYH